MHRIGAVSYLNTKPLIEGLAGDPQARLILDLPSRLSHLLETDQIDVGLIPIVDYLRQPALSLIPGISIACDGPVLSVMIFSRVPMDRVRTLACDEGSQTSVALARLLFARRFGAIPDGRPFPLFAKAESILEDAVLLIGNRALCAELPDFPYCWDLGLEWKRETGLPMVFAVWAAVPAAPVERIGSLLKKAKERGLARCARLAHEGSIELGIDGALCRRYLEQIIRFDLGPAECQAIARFAALSLAHGLIAKGYNRNHELLSA